MYHCTNLTLAGSNREKAMYIFNNQKRESKLVISFGFGTRNKILPPHMLYEELLQIF